MSDIDPKKLSFKQREGFEPLPKPLGKEEIPVKLRNALWKIFDTMFYYDKIGGFQIPVYDISYGKFIDEINNLPHDSPKSTFNELKERTRNTILHSNFPDIMDFLENAIKYYSSRKFDTEPAKSFSEKIKSSFKKDMPHWNIIFEGEDTIFQYSISDLEIDTLNSAYDNLKVRSYGGALNHMVSATKHFNDKKWNESIRESIHAVESLCRTLVGDEKATLSSALKALETRGIKIHKALNDAFQKLYGYAGDEDGVRHAQTKEVLNCDQADAQFMLGACAAFISYLCAKAEIA